MDDRMKMEGVLKKERGLRLNKRTCLLAQGLPELRAELAAGWTLRGKDGRDERRR